MTDPRAKYDAALAAFAVKGNRWNGTSALTYWGAACGMDADEVIESAHSVGVTNRDSDIRAGMITAAARIKSNAERWNQTAAIRTSSKPTRHKAKQEKPPQTVRSCIRAGADIDTPDKLSEISPVKICADCDKLARRVQCELMLLAMFTPAEVVRLRRCKEDNARSVLGQNMKPTTKWISGDVHAVDFGEVVRVNSLTGAAGLTRDGTPSFDALSCVASFRHTVFEFDEMPISEQCQFWAGFIRNCRLAECLVCLVYSGGKSIHGVVAVDAFDASTFANYRAEIIRAFASDPDKRYCLDAQALSPLTGARLAGATRKDTGKMQRLLYVREQWRDDDLRQMLNPPEETTNNTERSRFAAHCGTCPTINDCKQAFGYYWGEKSHGGVGCNCPFAYMHTGARPNRSHVPIVTQDNLF